MKTITKNTALITFLLFTTSFNTWSMNERPSNWLLITGGVLLGAATVKMLWQEPNLLLQPSELLEPSEPIQPFPFTELPKEIQDQIIELLSIYTTATSLKDAARTINALAQVNKKLNQKINTPVFCLKLIKHLAMKFECSDEEVADILQTQEAKRRLTLQDELYEICSTPADTMINPNLPSIKILCDEGVDLNFTYATKKPKLVYTPLMLTILTKNTHIMDTLLNIGKDKIKLDYQNLQGDTALMICCKQEEGSWLIDLENIALLLYMGANPELPNFAGITPYTFVKTHRNLPISKDSIIIMEHEIEQKNKPDTGMTLLMKAAQNCTLICIRIVDRILKSYPSEINEQDTLGNTALLYSITTPCLLNPLTVVLTLLQANADPEIANFNGLTPLAAAQNNGNKKIINIIEITTSIQKNKNKRNINKNKK